MLLLSKDFLPLLLQLQSFVGYLMFYIESPAAFAISVRNFEV
jgi:hypothetical protein